jgi:hypothetical protein
MSQPTSRVTPGPYFMLDVSIEKAVSNAMVFVSHSQLRLYLELLCLFVLARYVTGYALRVTGNEDGAIDPYWQNECQLTD